MQRAFVESMKTIAQTAIEKAGFDKTRNGKIVGVNSITNTYSVRVDGIVYNNVKVVNDMTCNVGDTVKVNIPMNNPSQAYITSSILSDESIGQKIAQATTAIDDINNQIESIAEIANSIYQLSVDVSYANDGNYKNVTYTAMLMQDGVNVTEDHEASEFRWYLEKTTGTEELSDSPAWAVVLSTRDYFYGQSILLEWTYTYTDVISGEQKTTKLRSRVTLISNDAIQQVAKYTTEVTNGGVFVHRADGNYDVGADWESTWAYGVKIANTVDIIKGGKIYGSFGGDYLTVGNTSGNNIYMDANSFIQLRKGSTVLTDIRPGSITLGNTSAGYYYTYIDSSNVKFRRNVNGTIRDIATFNSSGITLKNDNGINLMSLTSGGLNLYNGNSSSNVNIVSVTNSGMTIRNANNQVLMSMSSNALNLYYIYSSSTTYNVATFGGGGMTLRNTSGYTTFNANSNSLNLYYYNSNLTTNVNILSISGSGLTLRDTDNKRMSYFGGSSAYLGETSASAYLSLASDTFRIASSSYGLMLYPTAKATYPHVGLSDSTTGGYQDISAYIHVEYNKTYGHRAMMHAGSGSANGSYGRVTIEENMVRIWAKKIDITTFVGSSSEGFVLDWGSPNGSASTMIKLAYVSSSSTKYHLQFPHSYVQSGSGKSAYLTEAGWLNVASSTRKIKRDIVYNFDETTDPHQLYNLRVAQFKYKDEYIDENDYNRNRNILGLIAEDVDEDYHIAAYHESDGTPTDWDERIIIPALVQLVQEQKQMIDNLIQRVENLEQKE